MPLQSIQMALLNSKTQMTDTKPSETIVATESELVMEAETAIGIGNEETAAETRSRERTERRMGLQQVITAVHMEVQRVGAEAEVVMMTADTHVATEIALMKPAAEMGTITEVVVVCAHGLGVLIEISTARESAGIAMMATLLQGKTAAAEMIVARAEARNGRVHPH